jgi:hypothetical protein
MVLAFTALVAAFCWAVTTFDQVILFCGLPYALLVWYAVVRVMRDDHGGFGLLCLLILLNLVIAGLFMI